MSALVSQRLNEAGGGPFYPGSEITSALNEANRVFCLLTLGLEVTSPWNVAANTTFFHMLGIFSDWLVPLRISNPFGTKIRPAKFSELWSLDPQWPASPGAVPAAPTRYAAAGADLVALYGQPTTSTVLNVTYARAPVALVNAGDTPETPAEYHPAYVSYGINRMRQVEGGAPFASTLPLLAEFMDAAQQYGEFIRARAIASGYDSLPFELALFDRSRLVGLASKQKA
jgi:hypothetical protein